jgi:hypothetical protein
VLVRPVALSHAHHGMELALCDDHLDSNNLAQKLKSIKPFSRRGKAGKQAQVGGAVERTSIRGGAVFRAATGKAGEALLQRESKKGQIG